MTSRPGTRSRSTERGCEWPISDRTGLGPLETAVIRTVGSLSGPALEYVRCSDVLDSLEHEELGATYMYRVLQDLTVSWRLQLPLLDGQGNFGSPGNDLAADATYTEVRLSPIGRLALCAESGEVGPLPLALIEGSVYRGGRVPPFAPQTIVDTLRRLLPEPAEPFTNAELDLLIGPPTLPTGGIVDGDLPALLRGEPTDMRMTCRIEHTVRNGHQVLEITGYPLGVNVDLMLQCIADRARFPNERRGGGTRYIADIQDHSSDRTGIRIQVVLRHDADPDDAEQWLRMVWPVSVDDTWRLPSPMSERLRTAAQATTKQPSGLRQLRALL